MLMSVYVCLSVCMSVFTWEPFVVVVGRWKSLHTHTYTHTHTQGKRDRFEEWRSAIERRRSSSPGSMPSAAMRHINNSRVLHSALRVTGQKDTAEEMSEDIPSDARHYVCERRQTMDARETDVKDSETARKTSRHCQRGKKSESKSEQDRMNE